MFPPIVLVAIISTFGILAVALVNGYFARSAAKALRQQGEELHAAVATNHGKRPGEYLEMVADVVVNQTMLDLKLDRVLHALSDHTAQDAANFHAIEVKLAEMTPLPDGRSLGDG